jgi:hypothetical protein
MRPISEPCASGDAPMRLCLRSLHLARRATEHKR